MPLTKALIINTDAAPPLQIPVMFNPPQYQLTKTNQFAEVGIPGLGSSLLQFVRGSLQTLTMDLFFDTTDDGRDVRDVTDTVVGLTTPNPETHVPPRLLFLWGSLGFPCVLEQVTETFDYFDARGVPLRARLTVSFKEHQPLETVVAGNQLLSADRAKRRVHKLGDSLQRIAAEEYGDPRSWRPIADASGIDNPLTIPPGRGLTVPR